MAIQLMRNIRHSLKSWVPNWLSDRPNGLNVGFAVLWVICYTLDGLIEALLEGLRAAWPGKGTFTADYLIGQSRGFTQGLTETNAAYETRLRAWLDFWTNSAGDLGALAQLVQTFLGNNLVVRCVDRFGHWATANSNGTITKTIDSTWNWDSLLTYRAGWWSDIWIIIYVTDGRYPIYANTSDANWIAAWGTKSGFGTGFQIPRNVVDGINAIIAPFKGAHTWVETIIWTSDTTLFVPGSLGGYPAGDHGLESFAVNGVQVTTRRVTNGGNWIRYQDPMFGG